MASTNVLFYFSLTFRSSHYVSSALDLTYLLVHLHTIEIILFLSLSLSLYLSHSPLMFVLLLILFVICIRYAWNIFFLVFILFSFCSLVIVGYAPIFDEVFYPLLSIIPNSQMESIFRLAENSTSLLVSISIEYS